jgi:hypothetical protein
VELTSLITPLKTRNIALRIGFAFHWSPYFKAVPEIQQDNGPRLKWHRVMKRNNMGYTARISTLGPSLEHQQIFSSDRITFFLGFKPLTSLVTSTDLFEYIWLLDLLFDPEDGGSTFLRNVGQRRPHYTASHI